MSYADYARSGYFQLLAVAAITLAVLLSLRALTERGAVRFLVLAETTVALVLVVLVAAVRRLHLYEQAYGMTMLRLVCVLFAVWLGAVFVLVGVALARPRDRRQWVVPAALALAFAGLFVTNVANPEAYVVRRNVERFAGSERLDVWYLGSLSDDAVPAIAEALDDLPPEQADLLRAEMCRRGQATGTGPFGWNASEARAEDVRNDECGREV